MCLCSKQFLIMDISVVFMLQQEYLGETLEFNCSRNWTCALSFIFVRIDYAVLYVSMLHNVCYKICCTVEGNSCHVWITLHMFWMVPYVSKRWSLISVGVPRLFVRHILYMHVVCHASVLHLVIKCNVWSGSRCILVIRNYTCITCKYTLCRCFYCYFDMTRSMLYTLCRDLHMRRYVVG